MEPEGHPGTAPPPTPLDIDGHAVLGRHDVPGARQIHEHGAEVRQRGCGADVQPVRQRRRAAQRPHPQAPAHPIAHMVRGATDEEQPGQRAPRVLQPAQPHEEAQGDAQHREQRGAVQRGPLGQRGGCLGGEGKKREQEEGEEGEGGKEVKEEAGVGKEEKRRQKRRRKRVRKTGSAKREKEVEEFSFHLSMKAISTNTSIKRQYIYVSLYVHIHTYTYMYIRVCVYIYIFIYICTIYICV